MQWEDREESSNVEDQRGAGRRTGLMIGGGSGLVLLVLALIFGVDPRQLMNPGGGGPQPGNGQPVQESAEEQRQAHFSKVIFHDTEVVWDDVFRKMGKRYEKPTLVLFRGEAESACGLADSAVGPFYCPGDAKVYIDLSFYNDMERKLNAPGEFARAYVIAHEVGHHVQHLLGYGRHADEFSSRARGQQNKNSVRLELQADYLAGVWAHHGQERFHFLDQGDLPAALNAAFQIGDDRLQKKARGYVVPDSFTHGSSQQRQRWFLRGFKTGSVDDARLLFDMSYE